jgi:hypothetical protein
LNELENVMRDLLKSLAGCKNVATLRSSIDGLSTEFGAITLMDILTMKQPGKRQAMCFLRPESPSQEEQLMANLGVTRFGSDLVFVVDLLEDAKPAGRREGFLARATKQRRSSPRARRELDRETGLPNRRHAR